MAEEKEGEAASQSGSGLVPTLIAVAIVSLVSAGAGAGLAWHKATSTTAAHPEVASEKAAEKAPSEPVADPTTKIVDLPSIMTNLAGERAPWLRLDISVVLPVALPDQTTKVAELSDDFLTFLRTLKVDQLSGGSNLQFLKQDLREIARIRTSEPAVDVLIRSFILE